MKLERFPNEPEDSWNMRQAIHSHRKAERISYCSALVSILGCVFFAILVSCYNTKDTNKPIEKTLSQTLELPRFTVKSQGKFHAGFRNHEREILIITDRNTHQEYLAITGVGVSELMQVKITTEE